MEPRTVLIICGVALLGVGAFMAAEQPAEADIAPDDCTPVTPAEGNPLVTNTPGTTSPGTPQWVLAQTAWGEARGEGSNGMQAVLNVIMNRSHAGNFPGGSNPSAVATARNQFSAWNANRAQMLAVTQSDPQFRIALTLAGQALAGTLADLTDGAVFYHESSIATPSSWGQVAETTQIGNHIFYVRG